MGEQRSDQHTPARQKNIQKITKILSKRAQRTHVRSV